ncbi:OLC1v1018290C1 [Oldenlandia corymbosa var. corymbosa]|uniref:OLC1v1018290C1 n=1 Tax=Oldenlandia corymbosa var. corymbosa TaxID=529605 RepID=A0AAV1EBL9_OLDCO|nr:OLC1v1018290C1 [Oldenlandia corymbosa var. corymbosa]
MKSFISGFSSFIPLLLVLTLQLYHVFAAAGGAESYGVYIVYTGGAAAGSSSSGFPSDHILSSSSMERWKDRVIHTYNYGFSGFAAQLTKEEAESIAQRPEVISVIPDRVHQLHTTHSWDFLKDLSSVKSRPRFTSKSKASSFGEDTIIGIFDTGIWPESKSFNDVGMGPVPKRWKGKCIQGRDLKPFNCNRKLIGARNYATNGNFTSPRDRDGHGTHVAGIAAGRRVGGASYHGLAQGIAQGGSPNSRIALYRVCDYQNCYGYAALKAFDDAIADGVDVISLSFGSIFADLTRDPVAIGSFHATEKGILVTASAGNGGDSETISSVDNVAPWILTVGATTMDRFFESDVVLGGNQVIKGAGIHFAKIQKTPVYPLITGAAANNSDRTADLARFCSYSELDANKVKGKIVLCETLSVYDSAQMTRETIKSMGGIGVIYVDYFSKLVDSISDSIPLVPVNRQDALQILSYINSTRNPVATILPTEAITPYKPAPSVASFSGKGPVFGNDYLIKPDVAAPGVDIISAWPSNDTDRAFNILSGTSVATPHVSGIAALVKSRYPSWSPSAIKSAIMTTAIQSNNMGTLIKNKYGNPATPYYFGAGEVTMFDPLEPGLVYETEVTDYLEFLCNLGYNAPTIKLISSNLPANFSCPTNSSKKELISNMNYPSIVIIQSKDGKYQTVKRTVTNVGDEESVYSVSVEANEQLEVRVNPTKLNFTRNMKKLSYEVTFTYTNGTFNIDWEFTHGSIIWSNQKHRVRIPFVVRLFPTEY